MQIRAIASVCLYASAVTAAAVTAQQQAQSAPPTLIHAGRVADVRTGTYLSDQGILIEGERITRTGAFEAVRGAAPAGVLLIDLGRSTVLPGLIDAHTHLLTAMDPAINGADELILTLTKYSPGKRALLGARMARELLEGGFTTARNVGNSGIDGDVALRDAIRGGWVPGPRIIASARKLTPIGGQAIPVQTAVLQALLDQEYLPVGTPDEGRRAVAENLRVGANFIKVIADEWPRVIDAPTMKAIADEAHRAAARVAVHATTKPGIQAAIDAGVDSIEHADEATEQQFQAIRDRKIVVVPTLWPLDLLPVAQTTTNAPPGTRPATQKDKDAYVAAERAKLNLARKVGVTIAFGSDAWFAYPDRSRGQVTRQLLEALQTAFGMPAPDVLRAATVTAADLLNVAHLLGTVEAARYADLIAVDGDPLADVAALEKIRFVMKGGAIIVRLEKPLP